MGREQEWKLEVSGTEQLDIILAWGELQAFLTEQPRVYRMQTTYYDTPDRALSARNITLRRRMENDCSIVCVKAPLPGEEGSGVRGEWELPSQDLERALPRLIALGAPALLLELPQLIPVCGAEFLRRAMLLRFSDGSTSELALDSGSLLGSSRRIPLCELELEMKSGGTEATLRLLHRLMTHFGLRAQLLSKYARARALL